MTDDAGEAQDDTEARRGGRLFDWFGSVNEPIPRASERLSLVFAFADDAEEFPGDVAQ